MKYKEVFEAEGLQNWFEMLMGQTECVCVLAPLMKVKEWKTCPSFVSMLIGGMTLITSMILKSSGNRNAWILAVVALICIAISAWINGGAQDKRHLSHHIVRWSLSLLIVVGFVLL